MSGPFRPEAVPRPENYATALQWQIALVEFLINAFAELQRISQTQNTPARMPYSVENLGTASRTLDTGAATLAQLRDVVGTMIEDLANKRVLKTKGSA